MYQSGDIIPDQCIASGNDEKTRIEKPQQYLGVNSTVNTILSFSSQSEHNYEKHCPLV